MKKFFYSDRKNFEIYFDCEASRILQDCKSSTRMWTFERTFRVALGICYACLSFVRTNVHTCLYLPTHLTMCLQIVVHVYARFVAFFVWVQAMFNSMHSRMECNCCSHYYFRFLFLSNFGCRKFSRSLWAGLYLFLSITQIILFKFTLSIIQKIICMILAQCKQSLKTIRFFLSDSENWCFKRGLRNINISLIIHGGKKRTHDS